jgi:hypothetical protein
MTPEVAKGREVARAGLIGWSRAAEADGLSLPERVEVLNEFRDELHLMRRLQELAAEQQALLELLRT